jgi:hypothetical protein
MATKAPPEAIAYVAMLNPNGGPDAFTVVDVDLGAGLTATAVHSISYLPVTTLVAWLVFARLGVAVLRTSWINLDAIWAAALIITGVLTIALY